MSDEKNCTDIAFIHRTLRWLANGIVTDYQTRSLNPTLMEKVDKFYITLRSSFEWEKLTREDCIALGFLSFGAETNEEFEIFCIPAWLYPIIPEGLRVTDLNGTTFRFNKSEHPFEVNYGVLNFGMKFRNLSYKRKKKK